jgi:hypothetical protein
MQALQLDFSATRPSSPWVGRTLMAVAVAFSAHVSVSYMHARDKVDAGEAELARLGRSVDGSKGAGSRQGQLASPEEMRVARETVERLSLEWNNLFGALESSPTGAGADVALLTIEPDARAGTALIGGEAKDYDAALRYVSALAGTSALRNVHLVRHELRDGGSRRPLAFTVSASWKDSR